MKRLFLLLIFFLPLCVFSQASYILDGQAGKQTFYTCSGEFFDTGGDGSLVDVINFYQDFENDTITFCPDNPGKKIRFIIEEFNLEIGDFITFYDGTSTNSSNSLGIYTQSVFGMDLYPTDTIQASSINSDGCITAVFISDGDTKSNTGWKIDISCIVPCQQIIASGSINGYQSQDSIFKICKNNQICFEGYGIYPDMGTSNQLYDQNNNTSQIKWFISNDFGNYYTIPGIYNPSTGHKEACFLFQDTGIYHVNLYIRDTLSEFECINQNFAHNIIYVSEAPKISSATLIPSICLGDSNLLVANLNELTLHDNCDPDPTPMKLIPDNQQIDGLMYTEHKMQFKCYGNQVINAASDIESICIEIEHSAIGDLDMKLSCPNGNSVDLLVPNLSSGANLGTPILAGNGIGTMASYCFTESASQTINQAATALPTTSQITSGFYLPETSFSNLLGCPLNGDWKLVTKDIRTNDNGWVLLASINFNPSISFFSDTLHQISIVNQNWLANSSNPTLDYSSNTNFLDSLIVLPNQIGTFNYQFQASDAFGCSLDTTFTFEVLDRKQADFTYNGLTNYCEGTIATLIPQFTPGALGIMGEAGVFSSIPVGLIINPSTGVIDIQSSNPGSYSVVNFVLTSGSNCIDEYVFPTSITIYPKPDPVITAIGTDCNLDTLIVQAGLDDNPYTSYQWSNGSNNDTLFLYSDITDLTIDIVDIHSCIGSSSPIDISLTDIQTPTTSLSNTQTYCESDYKIVDDLATLGNGGNLVYNYKNGAIFELVNLSDTLQSGEYYISQSYPNSACLSSDSLIISVIINTTPTPNSSSNIIDFCANGQLVSDLSISNSGGVLNYFLVYNNTPQAINPTNELLEGTYFITEINPLTSCLSSDSLQIEVYIHDLPNPAIISLYDTIPIGMNHSIIADNVLQNQTLNWWQNSTSSAVISADDTLNLSITSNTNFLLQAVDLTTGCLSKIDTLALVVANLKYFNVYRDLNNNCAKEVNEENISSFMIYILPDEFIGYTDFNGNYIVPTSNYGNYTAYFDSTQLGRHNCVNYENFSLSITPTNPSYLGIQFDQSCANPSVNIYASHLIRCFSNRMVYVAVSNYNYTNTILNNALIQVELDNLITLNNANYSYTNNGNNTYIFDIGDLIPFQNKTIEISTTVSCNAVLNQSLCSSAFLYNYDPCYLDTIQNYSTIPCSSPYDQSDLIAEGWCENDSIKFTVKNQALAGVGDMSCYTPVRIYIDGIFSFYDSIKLLGQEEQLFSYVGDGKTWVIQVDQHPLFPYYSNPSAFVEACGLTSNWTPNYVNQLALNSIEPISDSYCGTVSGSYDPNDKTGYPFGVNTTHDIMPNESIEYVIRFQNTGNDTAHTVVIRDTLDQDLNIFSVTSGASDHDYTFNILSSRVLEWRFDSIMLPDSTTNEPFSKGFISFKVNQNQDLIKGTEITNKANIYFDFNDPIITNQTLHTINPCLEYSSITQQNVATYSESYHWGLSNQTYTESGLYDHRLQSAIGCDSIIRLNLTLMDGASVKAINYENQILIYPNPSTNLVKVEFKDLDPSQLKIKLIDLTGKQILELEKLNYTNEIKLSDEVAKGTYFLNISNETNDNLLRTKIVLQ